MLKCLKNPEPFLKEEVFVPEEGGTAGVDFADIEGQDGARRAAERSQSADFQYSVYRTAGDGENHVCQKASTIMPPLTFEEKLELTRIYSIAGLLSEKQPLISQRPFRSPHHTSSPQSMAGGGKNPKPGEITLAHRGVLFLDEMPEFSRRSLELLRQPLEDRVIQISRVSGTYLFPADFMLS